MSFTAAGCACKQRMKIYSQRPSHISCTVARSFYGLQQLSVSLSHLLRHTPNTESSSSTVRGKATNVSDRHRCICQRLCCCMLDVGLAELSDKYVLNTAITLTYLCIQLFKRRNNIPEFMLQNNCTGRKIINTFALCFLHTWWLQARIHTPNRMLYTHH